VLVEIFHRIEQIAIEGHRRATKPRRAGRTTW
jgi:hypothetical protein